MSCLHGEAVHNWLFTCAAVVADRYGLTLFRRILRLTNLNPSIKEKEN